MKWSLIFFAIAVVIADDTRNLQSIDIFSDDGILSALAGVGSGSGTTKLAIVQKFTATQLSDLDNDVFKNLVKVRMATTLFNDQVKASDIAVTVTAGGRRLLATFTVRSVLLYIERLN